MSTPISYGSGPGGSSSTTTPSASTPSTQPRSSAAPLPWKAPTNPTPIPNPSLGDGKLIPAQGQGVRCYRCDQPGHYSRDCPHVKTILFNTLTGHVVEDFCEEEGPSCNVDNSGLILSMNELLQEGEEVEVRAPQGDCFVVKRMALTSSEHSLDTSQRANLFHTRCVIKGKLCSVIIDGGSCCNIVNQEVVERFQIPLIPHPSPYTLQWLNSSSPLEVSSQALIDLSIGPYHDCILCDVLPMSACHILLGRPWQFDRQVIHDGFTNVYSFSLDGRKVRLVPLTPHEIMLDHVKKEQKKAIKEVDTQAPAAPHLHLGPKGTPPYLLLAQSKEVRRAYEGGDTCFLITYLDSHVSLFSQTNLDSLPSPISLILKEFKDMFPEEMPTGLPPL